MNEDYNDHFVCVDDDSQNSKTSKVSYKHVNKLKEICFCAEGDNCQHNQSSSKIKSSSQNKERTSSNSADERVSQSNNEYLESYKPKVRTLKKLKSKRNKSLIIESEQKQGHIQTSGTSMFSIELSKQKIAQPASEFHGDNNMQNNSMLNLKRKKDWETMSQQSRQMREEISNLDDRNIVEEQEQLQQRAHNIEISIDSAMHLIHDNQNIEVRDNILTSIQESSQQNSLDYAHQRGFETHSDDLAQEEVEDRKKALDLMKDYQQDILDVQKYQKVIQTRINVILVVLASFAQSVNLIINLPAMIPIYLHTTLIVCTILALITYIYCPNRLTHAFLANLIMSSIILFDENGRLAQVKQVRIVLQMSGIGMFCMVNEIKVLTLITAAGIITIQTAILLPQWEYSPDATFVQVIIILILIGFDSIHKKLSKQKLSQAEKLVVQLVDEIKYIEQIGIQQKPELQVEVGLIQEQINVQSLQQIEEDSSLNTGGINPVRSLKSQIDHLSSSLSSRYGGFKKGSLNSRFANAKLSSKIPTSSKKFSTTHYQNIPDNMTNILAIQEFFISNLNKGVILCKLNKTMKPVRKKTFDQLNFDLEGKEQLAKRLESQSQVVQDARRGLSDSMDRNINGDARKPRVVEQTSEIAMKIIKISDQFFENLPKTDAMEKKCIEFYQKRVAVSHGSNLSSQQIKSSNSLSGLNLNNSLSYDRANLDTMQNQLLLHKMYQPYFINHATILQFQSKKQKTQKYSIKGILDQNFQDKKQFSRLYFMVDLNEEEENERDQVNSNSDQSLEYAVGSEDNESKPIDRRKRNIQSSQIERYSKQQKQEKKMKYYEIEITLVEAIAGYKNETDMQLVNIKDITHVVINQQRYSDMKYQEALENTYSHENMTPLNCIQSNAFIVKKRLLHLYAKNLGINIESSYSSQINQYGLEDRVIQQIVENSSDAKDTLKVITAVEHSAKSMWFYNQNQIKRMKAKKNQLKIKMNQNSNLFKIISNVVEPFTMQIQNYQLKVYAYRNRPDPVSIITDWKLFELILFNIIRNAVQYNSQEGEIIIIMKLRKGEVDMEDDNHILQTNVVDSGQGISEEKKSMLFVPFLELKTTKGIANTDSIGVGLACSKALVNKLGGDIHVKTSQRGLTDIEFWIPVKCKLSDESSSGLNHSNNTNKQHSVHLMGVKKEITKKVKEYLDSQEVVLDRTFSLNVNNSNSVSFNKSDLGVGADGIIFSAQESVKIDKSAEKIGVQHFSKSDQQYDSEGKKQNDKLSEQVKIPKYQQIFEFKNSVRSSSCNLSFVEDSSISLNGPKDIIISGASLQRIEDRKEEHYEEIKEEIKEARKEDESNGPLDHLENRLELRNIPSMSEESKNSDQSPMRRVPSNENMIRAQRLQKKEHTLQKRYSSQYSKRKELERSLMQNGAQNLEHNEKKNLAYHLLLSNKYDDINQMVAKKRPVKQLQIKRSIVRFRRKGKTLQERRDFTVNKIGVKSIVERSKSNNNKELNQITPVFNRNLVNEQEYEFDKNVIIDEESSDLSPTLSEMASSNYKDILVNPDEIQEFKQKYRQGFSSRSASSNSFIAISKSPNRKESAQMVLMSNNQFDFDLFNKQRKQQSQKVLNNYKQQSLIHVKINKKHSMKRVNSNLDHQYDGLNSFSDSEIQLDFKKACNCQPKILVVDDNQFNIVALKAVLKETYEIDADEAKNGKEAVQLFRQLFRKKCGCPYRTYKMIFMDIQMPVKDGIEAAKDIIRLIKKAGINNPNFCNIIALTACTTDSVKDKAIQSGMKDLLAKPISSSIIENALFKYFFEFTEELKQEYLRQRALISQSNLAIQNRIQQRLLNHMPKKINSTLALNVNDYK